MTPRTLRDVVGELPPGVEARAAVIHTLFMDWEDHGIFAFNIDFSYLSEDGRPGSSGQGTGVYGLSRPSPGGGRHVRDAAYERYVVARCAKACGVRRWEEMKEVRVRVIRMAGWNGEVLAMERPGHSRDRVTFRSLEEEFRARRGR